MWKRAYTCQLCTGGPQTCTHSDAQSCISHAHKQASDQLGLTRLLADAEALAAARQAELDKALAAVRTHEASLHASADEYDAAMRCAPPGPQIEGFI